MLAFHIQCIFATFVHAASEEIKQVFNGENLASIFPPVSCTRQEHVPLLLHEPLAGTCHSSAEGSL